MLILAFDTTSELGGAGIFRDHECLASVANQGPANIYSVSLFQMVDQLVEQGRVRHQVPTFSLRDIELFAVANGPGSFTGIRVGLAAAQGWAKAFGRPVRGVSVLAAMVNEARPEADLAVPIVDARRGEFFLGFFRPDPGEDHGHFVPQGEGLVLKAQALSAFLEERLRPGQSVTCLARAHDRSVLGLRDVLPKSLRWQSVPGLLVGAIARLALEAQRQGRLQSPSELDAYYIRRPDAEINWRG